MTYLMPTQNTPWTKTLNDRLLSDFFNDFFWPETRRSSESAREWFVPVDIHEDEKKYTLAMDVPGVAKDQIKIALDNGVLTISGERKSETNVQSSKTHRIERFVGTFKRSFNVGDTIESEAISARLTDGVLEVTLPKKATVTPRQIPIVT